MQTHIGECKFGMVKCPYWYRPCEEMLQMGAVVTHYCDFSTANESHLKVHLTKAHLGEWACPKCNYKAATGLRLDMHLKANHKSLWEECQQLV